MIVGLSLLLPMAIGLAALVVWWPEDEPLDPLLAAAAAWPVGFAITSSTWFLCKAATGEPGTGALAAELGLAAALGAWAWRRRSPLTHFRRQPAKRPLGGWLKTCVALLFVAALTIVGRVGWLRPLGSWDARYIWNLHAQFLSRSTHFETAIGQTPSFSHPDYPLLLSASVARVWSQVGSEPGVVPFVFGALFVFSTLLLLPRLVGRLRGPRQGALALAALTCAPVFLVRGATQGADVPVGFFLLATCACLVLAGSAGGARQRLIVLAGFFASAAAWTKNEGALMAVAVVAVCALEAYRRAGARAVFHDVSLLALGMAPVLAVLALFKLGAAPNDIVASLTAGGEVSAVDKLLDPDRHRLIFGRLLDHAVGFGGTVVGSLFVLPGYLALAGLDRSRWRSARSLAWVLAAVFCGYLLAYLLTPYEPGWHIDTSLERLLVQLWPSLVLLTFLLARPGARCEPPPSSRS